MENKEKANLFPIFAIIITILIIIGTIFFVISRRSSTYTQPKNYPLAATTSVTPSTPSTSGVNIDRVKIANEPFIGNPKAPVTIALWFDYQCPFCKRLEENTMPSIISNYVNTGKVKVVFKDFAFLGPDSQTASLVARAVWATAPNKFYEWYSAMYTKQDGENSGWGNKADILALTKTIPGINLAKVEQLLATNSSKYQQEIAADKAQASSFGINGTPALIIGKHLVVGAQPFSVIKPLIDAQLGK